MNIITVASRKGGSGKSTLTAHLASFVHKPSRPCLLIDADPQGSLTLFNTLRGTGEPALKSGAKGIESLIKAAKQDGIEWVFIDTPPNMSAVVSDAIRAATLVVIPARPSVFDLSAVKETIDLCRERRRPYAVVINGAPAKRDDVESSIVTQARDGLSRAKVPVWSGQITHRSAYSLAIAAGETAKEYSAESPAASEISRLWSAIEKSVKAIHGHHQGAAMHRAAA